MEVDSHSDLDCLLGIGVMMVELYAIEGNALDFTCSPVFSTLGFPTEIISRDHTATSAFIHSRRIFQGPGLPLSIAVYSDMFLQVSFCPPIIMRPITDLLHSFSGFSSHIHHLHP